MNIIYGIIGAIAKEATTGNMSAIKETVMEDSIEFKGNFSFERNKRQNRNNKHFYFGYKRFNAKLIKSCVDRDVHYLIRTSNKMKLILNHNMDLHPKPYSLVVDSCSDQPLAIDELTLLITTSNQYVDVHKDNETSSCKSFLKFLDSESFRRWQLKLGEILAEVKCKHAMEPLPSGRLSVNKMQQAIEYSRLLIPMINSFDESSMLTVWWDDRPSVERIHMVHWIRRRLSEVVRGLQIRPCCVNVEDIRMLNRAAEKIHYFDNDPDMIFLRTRLDTCRQYTCNELESICKAIEYDEAEEAVAGGVERDDTDTTHSTSVPVIEIKSSRCSNDPEIAFTTAVFVHESSGSELRDDKSTNRPIVEEAHSSPSRRATLDGIDLQSHRRRAFHRRASTGSCEGTTINSSIVHIGDTRVSAKKAMVAPVLRSPIAGRSPLQTISAGTLRNAITSTHHHRFIRNGNLSQDKASVPVLDKAPKYAATRNDNKENEFNANHSFHSDRLMQQPLQSDSLFVVGASHVHGASLDVLPEKNDADASVSTPPEPTSMDALSSCSSRGRWSGGSDRIQPIHDEDSQHNRRGSTSVAIALVSSSCVVIMVALWAMRGGIHPATPQTSGACLDPPVMELMMLSPMGDNSSARVEFRFGPGTVLSPAVPWLAPAVSIDDKLLFDAWSHWKDDELPALDEVEVVVSLGVQHDDDIMAIDDGESVMSDVSNDFAVDEDSTKGGKMEERSIDIIQPSPSKDRSFHNILRVVRWMSSFRAFLLSAIRRLLNRG